jgi:MoxR-like ATPase
MSKNTNLHQVSLVELKDILDPMYENRIPLYLWGRPSTGKTSSIRQFAQEKAKQLGLIYSEDRFGPEYFTMKVITLSQYDSPDLRGMPRVTGDNGSAVTEFIPTAELPRDGQGILFFDEMNLAFLG